MVETFIDNLLQDRNLRGSSTKWANWMSELKLTTCQYCVEQHGKIVDISVLNGRTQVNVNAHPRGKCVYVAMRTKRVGMATTAGVAGADFAVFCTGKLPEYYITKKDAHRQGWNNRKGNLHDVLPGKMIGGDQYYNDGNKLPSAPNRIWYEADINYTDGHRNRQRLVYSNDGLIFVSYDHCQTFYEII